MRAVRQEVPTPPVEKLYEVVVTLTPEEAANLLDGLLNVRWSLPNGKSLGELSGILANALNP
jgi:hypothetical protein